MGNFAAHQPLPAVPTATPAAPLPAGGTFYDRMQAGRPIAPAPAEKPVAYKIRPQLVSVTCLLEPGNGEREAFYCTISKEATLAVAALKAGAQVNIVVPTKQKGTWYLDTAPRPGDGYLIPAGRPYFRIRPITRQRFAAVQPVNKTLTLRFLIGQEIRPGYYQLEVLPDYVGESARACRKSGHLPVDGVTRADLRREADKLGKRHLRATLREQAQAGNTLAAARLKSEVDKRRARRHRAKERDRLQQP